MLLSACRQVANKDTMKPRQLGAAGCSLVHRAVLSTWHCV